MRKIIAFAFLILATSLPGVAKDYRLSSPDGKIEVVINENSYSINYAGNTVIKDAEAALELSDGTKIQFSDKIRKSNIRKGVIEHISAPLYRQKEFDFSYNSILIEYRNGFSIEWTVSDEGVAYRFATNRKGITTIKDETAVISFPEDCKAWLPYSTNPKKPQAMAFQNWYTEQMLSEGLNRKPRWQYLNQTFPSGRLYL